MKKLVNILKKLIVIWGLFSLAIFIIIAAYLTYFFIHSDIEQKKLNRPFDKIIYNTNIDDKEIFIRHTFASGNHNYTINIRQSNKLLDTYQLPFKEFGLYALQDFNLEHKKGKRNNYVLVLFSKNSDCEPAYTDIIWLLEYDGKIKLLDVFCISEMNKIKAETTLVWGNKRITLDYYDGYPYKSFIIPILIEIGEKIQVSPMLNEHSKSLMLSAFDNEFERRMEVVVKTNNFDKQKSYEKAKKEFYELINVKEIHF
jgi:hypothetical protein